MYAVTLDDEVYVTVTGRSIVTILLSLALVLASISYIFTPFPRLGAVDQNTEIEILDISPSGVSPGDDITVTFFSKYDGLEDSSITVWIHEWSSDSQRIWSEPDGQNAYHVNVSGSVSLEVPVENTYGWGNYYYYHYSSSMNYTFDLTIPDEAPYTNGETLYLQVILNDYNDVNDTDTFSVNSTSTTSVTYEVSGTIFGQNSEPIEGAHISYSNGTVSEDADTDSSGQYSIDLAPGVY
ncbi:MAG: hypothetical protein QF535_07065, partial [Anaerolineales bacterium]|nr:hypothetical protein [Anaerolineales bacterium]